MSCTISVISLCATECLSARGYPRPEAVTTARPARAQVVARRERPCGPVTTARTAWFERRGLVPPGTRTERLVAVGAVRAPGSRMAPPNRGSRVLPAPEDGTGPATPLRPRETS
ncbi:hypothetical protein ACWENA_11240 [Streptomyces sp. NPDC004779]